MTKQRLPFRQYIRYLLSVGRTSFRIAPAVGIIRLLDSVIQAILPIGTTYLASLTTTALADAYSGDSSASERVIVYVIATSAISIIMLSWGSISNYIAQKTRYKIEAAVEDKMITQFTSLPFEMYDDKTVVDLHEKAKRFSYFFSYIFDTLGSMVTMFVGAITALIALIAISPLLALIVLVAVIPGVVIKVRLARRQAQHWEANITRRRRMSNLSWMLQESQYIAEMRVYGVVRKLIHQHKRLRELDEKERLDMETGTIWKQLAADVGESLVELGSLVWIVYEIIQRNQPVGQFLYVQQMVSRAISEASSLANQLGNTDKDLANIVDYQRFMELQPQDVTGKKQLTDSPESIEIESVGFRYPKTKKQILHEVSMTIRARQHVAIVGENGAGKSTLIKLLLGLYRANTGDIRVDGTPLADIASDSWHRHIGLLQQNFVSYYFATIRENITYGDIDKEDSEAVVRKAMNDAEFSDVVDKLERGDRTYIERWMAEDNDDASGTELSGGQQQRLALARNFYRDAPIIILDEPTSAIDALAEARIFKRLFASGKTVIAISHRLSTIRKADVVYMMKDGRVVETGTADELIAARGEFYRLFESQLGE